MEAQGVEAKVGFPQSQGNLLVNWATFTVELVKNGTRFARHAVLEDTQTACIVRHPAIYDILGPKILGVLELLLSGSTV